MSNTESAEIQVVLTFIACFNENRIGNAMELLDNQVFYHNIPMEPMIGREAVEAFTRGFGVGTRFRAEWTVTKIAARDDIVLTERIDAFIAEDGHRFEIPLMGSFRVKDGLITEWRDYFDLADFERKLARLESNQVPAACSLEKKSQDSSGCHPLRWPAGEMGQRLD